MNAVVEMRPAVGGALVTRNMELKEVLQHVALVQEVMRTVMKPDVHYGKIPGTDKPTLYKSGAELLCMVFRIAQTYEVRDLSTADTVRYQSVCTGIHQTTGVVMGSGMGEASSSEAKYKWRKAYQSEFDATPETMRRTYQGYDKQKRQSYTVMQVRTEPADLANTILKMANKRAMLAMVLNVTAASDCFTQDLEDMDEKLRDHLAREGGPADGEGQQPAAASTPPAKPAWPDEAFDKQAPRWQKAVEAGLKTVEDILTMAATKGALTPAQEAKVRAFKKVEPAPAAEAPKVTYAQVAEKLHAAKDQQALDDAASLIKAVPDEQMQTELTQIYEVRVADLAQ